MPLTTTCPGCGHQLFVRETLPRRVLCPRCLTSVDNPYSRQATTARRVLPVDEDAATDVRDTASLLGTLALMLLVGGLGMIHFSWFGIVLIVGGLALGFAALRYRKLRPSENEGRTIRELEQSREADRRPDVLEYERRTSENPSVPAFLTGFLLAIGIGGGSFLALLVDLSGEMSPSGHSDSVRRKIAAVVVTIIVCLVIGVHWFGRKSRWNGFGRGVTTGLVLCATALGPCAVGLAWLLLFG